MPNVVSNYLNDRAVAGAINYISTVLTGSIGNMITQYANGESLSELNWSQAGWSGVTYGFGSYVSTTFRRGVSEFWGKTLAPNISTALPSIFGGWLVDINDQYRNDNRRNN